MSGSLRIPDEPAVTTGHWHLLQTLLLRSPLSSIFLLRSSPPAAMPIDYKLSTLLQFCSSSIQRQLLGRHLLSSLALFDHADKELQEFGKTTLRVFFREISLPAFISASWIAVPVPVVQGENGIVLTLMLGLAPGTGQLLMQNVPRIDQSSKEALETAFRLPEWGGIDKEYDLLVWTLQANNDPPLQGASLGLPALISLYLLYNNEQWPPGFFASGAITCGGQVCPVQHIQKKKHTLATEAELFVIPPENTHISLSPGQVSVQTAREAFFAVDCFLKGIHNGNSIALFQMAAKDPDVILGQFARLPVEFFRLYDLSAVLDKIQKYPERYFSKLASCLRKHSHQGEHAAVFAPLFNCKDVEKIAVKEEYAALKYCLGQLALHNHSGDIDKSRQWSICAKKIATLMSGRSELSQLVNEDFVNERFNRYDFRIRLPSLFSECLAYQKKMHELQEDNSRQLGAMYGTLAQNYGFCGPKYFGKLRQTADNALEAFGRKYRREHSQIESYLIYGLLDCKKFTEAKSALQHYLGVSESADVLNWITNLSGTAGDCSHDLSYKISLVCRFFAEQPFKFQEKKIYVSGLRNIIHRTLQQNRHPWQLTATNLARLFFSFQEPEQAKKLLGHAVSICTINGDTMQVMALLPLSLLHQQGMAEQEHFLLAEQLLHTIQTTGTLDRSHFSPLFSCRNGQEILARAFAIKSLLFPFTYT